MTLAPLLGLVLSALPVLPAAALAQDAGAVEPAAPAEEAAFSVPATVEEAVAVPKAELARALEALSVEETRAVLADWLALADAQHEAWLEARAAAAESGEAGAGPSFASDRDYLLARAEETLAALTAKGGEAEEARATIARILAASRDGDASTVPLNQSTAQQLDPEVLKALLRPMTLEQAQEQLDLWLALLQGKCREVTHAEVRALQSEDPEEIRTINARAVDLRAERARLIERTRIVLDAVEKKGGDPEAGRKYVGSVVDAPPVSGLRAAWGTTVAWLRNPDGGVALALRLARALAVLLASWIVALVVGNLVARAVDRLTSVSNLLKEFVKTTTRRVVLLLGAVLAVGQLGFSIGPVLAAIGAIGLVVGLALQGTLSNFASGLLIMFYRPFDVGDFIATGGPSGKVEGMTLVTTTIRTFDNQTIHVPNNTVWGGVITNINANPTRRVDMTFGIGYGDDADRAAEVLLDVVRSHEKVLDDPEPLVKLHELGESSVNLIVRPWVRTVDYWSVYWDVTSEVKRRFDAEGITIPFPQRDVHVYPAAATPGSDVGELRPQAPPERARKEPADPESSRT